MTEKTFPSLYQWNLYSSDGRASLAGNLVRGWREKSGRKLILAEIAVSVVWPDRTAGSISFDKTADDAKIYLPQVVLSNDSVVDLIGATNDWSTSTPPVSVNICEERKDQALTIYMGPPDPNTSVSKTIVKVFYSAIAIKQLSVSFPIDQSCIRIFNKELNDALSITHARESRNET